MNRIKYKQEETKKKKNNLSTLDKQEQGANRITIKNKHQNKFKQIPAKHENSLENTKILHAQKTASNSIQFLNVKFKSKGEHFHKTNVWINITSLPSFWQTYSPKDELARELRKKNLVWNVLPDKIRFWFIFKRKKKKRKIQKRFPLSKHTQNPPFHLSSSVFL